MEERQGYFMTLVFEDVQGHRGMVTDSLVVDYSGPWEQKVSEVVNEAIGDPPDDPLYDPADPLSYLVVKLPEDAPIREVGREDLMD